MLFYQSSILPTWYFRKPIIQFIVSTYSMLVKYIYISIKSIIFTQHYLVKYFAKRFLIRFTTEMRSTQGTMVVYMMQQATIVANDTKMMAISFLANIFQLNEV